MVVEPLDNGRRFVRVITEAEPERECGEVIDETNLMIDDTLRDYPDDKRRVRRGRLVGGTSNVRPLATALGAIVPGQQTEQVEADDLVAAGAQVLRPDDHELQRGRGEWLRSALGFRWWEG